MRKVLGMLNKLAVFILSFVLLFNSAISETILYDDSYTPYMYSQNGEILGVYPKLLRKVFNDINISYQEESLPWKRVLDKGRTSSAGIVGVYYNEERNKIFDYTNPFFTEELYIYYLKNDEGFNPKVLRDLANVEVGINLGWSYGEEFDTLMKNNYFQVSEAKTNLSNINKLSAGRIKAFLADKYSVSSIISKKQHIVRSQEPVLQNPVYLVFSKSSNKIELLKKIDDSILRLKATGEYQSIIESALN